jgi:S-adenosylmethionine:tRNA ribosyltransferase-isomerase
MDPKNISIEDFSYELPDDRIARYPLDERDSSRLLVFRDGRIGETIYRNISDYLPDQSLLVFNNSKVVEARLIFHKPTGGLIEIFCLEPHGKYPDVTSAMLQKGQVWWNCLIGGASKWKKGQLLEKKWNGICLEAKYIEKQADDFVIEFSWRPADMSFAEILHQAGSVPLPPYLKREAETTDKERYQTIYAVMDGSVAAPTAGLHFTERIFEKLAHRNITREFVTLHVGAGTFKPVKSPTLENHIMHQEFIEVSSATIQSLIQTETGKVIAVGTTSLRTLESLYWMGLKTMYHHRISPESLMVHQWEPYDERDKNVPAALSLGSLLEWMSHQGTDRLLTRTELLIVPGYSFRIVDGLVTNFHQPQSTLLLLVAALIGEEWKKVYQFALGSGFRFLSYGDGCLLFRRQS